MSNFQEECLRQMSINGLSFDGSLISDGEIHRFSRDSKKCQPDEWYVCYEGMSIKDNPYLICCYGTWSGNQERFVYKSYENLPHSSPERHQLEEEYRKRKKHQESLLQKEQEKRVARANEIWEESSNQDHCQGHSSYLERKKIKPYDIKYRVEKEGSPVIVIPLRNTEEELQGVQCIYEDGKKRIYGLKRGNFHVIGSLEGSSRVYVVEGYATGASVHEATKCPVIVAFDCGNLKPVIENLQKKRPDIRFIIAADNDSETPGNPGKTKAEEAGKTLGCSVTIPTFSEGFKLPNNKPPSDFNDLYVNFGIEEVSKQLDTFINLCVNRFKFISSYELIQNPPTANWLIKPYFDLGSLAVLFGEPGSMKSFLALDVGYCIATGHNWHGMPVRKQGTVFYIAGEGFAGLSKRFQAWSISNQVDLKETPFFVSDRAAQFLNASGASEVVSAMEELTSAHGAPALVVIDTLNRNFGPGDENKTEDMTTFINIIDSAIRVKYGCTVLIVHHSPLNDPKRARGASALRGALDWEYFLSKKDENTRKLSITKVKDYDSPPDLYFEPLPIQLEGWVDPDDDEVMTSCVLKKIDDNVYPKNSVTQTVSGIQQKVLDCLIKLELASDEPRGVHIDIWRQTAYQEEITKSSNHEAKKKAFNRAFSQLENKGIVFADGDHWKVRDTGTDKGQRGTCPPN